MRPTSQVFIALIALVWSSASVAENNISTPTTLDPAVLSALADLDLDAAFERAAWPISDKVLYGLCGPTTMNCTTDKGRNAIETCEVKAEGVPAPTQASLAQH
jgi:hypothetical protein